MSVCQAQNYNQKAISFGQHNDWKYRETAGLA